MKRIISKRAPVLAGALTGALWLALAGVAAAQDDPIGALLQGAETAPAAEPVPAATAPPVDTTPVADAIEGEEEEEAAATAPPPEPAATPAAPQPYQPLAATPPAPRPYSPTPSPPVQPQPYAPATAGLPAAPLPYSATAALPAAPQPYSPQPSSPQPYSPQPYSPMAAASPGHPVLPPSPQTYERVTAPVHIDEIGKSPDRPLNTTELNYEARLRSSFASAQGMQGPLDGSWTLAASNGGDLYGLELVDRRGRLEGAWRDLKRIGALGASGFVDDIQRYGSQLTLRFYPEGAEPMVATLTSGPDGRWAGELTDGSDRKPVVLRRN